MLALEKNDCALSVCMNCLFSGIAFLIEFLVLINFHFGVFVACFCCCKFCILIFVACFFVVASFAFCLGCVKEFVVSEIGSK